MTRRLAPLLACLLLPAGFSAFGAEHVLTLVAAKDKPVADAVVSLTPLDASVPPPTEPAPEVAIAQRDKEFVPFVVAVRTGATVRFPNEDDVQHHVYSLSAAKRFDIPLHGGATASGIVLDQPGVVAVGCNIHDWMRSYIVIVDTPWFARSHADGVARLTAPAGRYRREIWHHRLARPVSEEIVLSDETPRVETVSLALRRDRHPTRREDADPAYP